MAAMATWAAETYGDHAAARFKEGGEWRTTSYADMGAIVREIGLGLMDIGVESGDRVCILGNTRPEWTYVDLAASSLHLMSYSVPVRARMSLDELRPHLHSLPERPALVPDGGKQPCVCWALARRRSPLRATETRVRSAGGPGLASACGPFGAASPRPGSTTS